MARIFGSWPISLGAGLWLVVAGAAWAGPPEPPSSSKQSGPNGGEVPRLQELPASHVRLADWIGELARYQPPVADEPPGAAPAPPGNDPPQRDEATTSQATASDLEEVVVTAQKRPQRLQDVPGSITVLGRQTLEDAQILSLREVAANAPNVFTTSGDRSFNFQTIRGLSNSNYLVRDVAGFYIDDVPFENVHQFFPGELFDLERVEILRGPQSTLYGRNSQAGVINITSRQPGNRPEYRLAASYGNYNQRQGQLALNLPIALNQLALRVSGIYNAREGFVRNTFLGSDANGQEGTAGRAILAWTPGPAWNVTLSATASANHDGPSFYLPRNQAASFQVARDFPGSLDLSLANQALRIAYSGEVIQITSITAHSFTDYRFNSDADGGTLDLARSINRLTSEIWSQEVRIQSPTRSRQFRWLLGGYLQSRDFAIAPEAVVVTAQGAPLFGFPGAGTQATRAFFSQTSYSVFGQVEYEPVEALTLTAGLRYERSSDQLSRRRTFDTGTTQTQLIFPIEASRAESDAVLPRFALQYRVGPEATLYANIARGYRPATQNYQATATNLVLVRPEQSWNYEIGFKSNWLDNRLRANFAAFYTVVNNYQASLPGPNGLPTDVANADLESRGIELELAGRPFDGFDVVAGLGYTDARYTNYTNPFTNTSFNGKSLTYSPAYTFNLALQYRSPGGFFSRIELQGVGRVYFDNSNLIEQEPYTLVGARLGYENGGYGIYFYVRNLFDTRYFTAAFGNPTNPSVAYGDLQLLGVQIRSQL